MILAPRSVAFASMLTAPRLVLEAMEASVVKEHLDFLYGGTFQHTMLNSSGHFAEYDSCFALPSREQVQKLRRVLALTFICRNE